MKNKIPVKELLAVWVDLDQKAKVGIKRAKVGAEAGV